jgi:hypothetical protein
VSNREPGVAMFYQPVKDQRFFCVGNKYDQINWRDFREVVKAFRMKLQEWYLVPADLLRPNWDHAFSLMAINCLLIDALSQYYYGQRASGRSTFKKFVRRKLPEFRAELPEPIRENPSRRKRRKAPTTKLKPQKTKYLYTFADVLYVAFRCGILHEAHTALCGGLAGLGGKMCDVDTDVCTRYRDGSDCPTVRMDPQVIYDALKVIINDYLDELIDPNPKYEPRRRKFKHKFKASFGIDVAGSRL